MRREKPPMPKRPTMLEALAKKARYAALGVAIGSGEVTCTPPEACAPQEEVAPEETPEIINPFFDTNPDFFRPFPHGEFTKEERKARTETLPNGEEVFRDIGLTFYKVKKGDTLSEIRENLSKYDEFAYLKDQPGKLESFNIPAKYLQIGMWLPIPLENKDRHLTDEQFAKYAKRGIEEMQNHAKYGKAVRDILEKISEEELVASLIAVAKQESGGKPIGNFELHRWEQHHRAFSFSLFHVLMRDTGLTARRNLNLTEGQLYHPQNAAKLFLAFLQHKTALFKKTPASYFPIDQHIERFAVMYNGSAWRKTNPNYDTNVVNYLALARTDLSPTSKN